MTTMEERIAAYDAKRAQRVLNVEDLRFEIVAVCEGQD